MNVKNGRTSRARKVAVASNRSGLQEREGQVPILCDELVARLEEVDRLIREEIKREVSSNSSNNGSASSRLACLMRSRADVQSAITCLLGAGH